MKTLHHLFHFVTLFNRWFDRNLAWFFTNGNKTAEKGYSRKQG